MLKGLEQVVGMLLTKVSKNAYIATSSALGVVESPAAICVAAGLGGVTLNVRN